MFIYDWFKSALESLGLLNKQAKIVLLGLDNAGKTTMMGVLRTGHMSAYYPTRDPTTDSVTMGGVTFSLHDVGGHKEVRRIWKDYMHGVDAVVFLVDASDVDRMQESKDALDSILGMPDCTFPILILGNKIDLPTVVSFCVFLLTMIVGALGIAAVTGVGSADYWKTTQNRIKTTGVVHVQHCVERGLQGGI